MTPSPRRRSATPRWAYIFNGSWAHCWLEYGTEHRGRASRPPSTHGCRTANEVLVVLNNPNYGGCGGGGRAIVPMGVDWTVIAHEFGHGIGGFVDEYSARRGRLHRRRAELDQRDHHHRPSDDQVAASSSIRPRRCRPASAARRTTTRARARPTWSSNFDVGLFEGGVTYDTGIYRPVENCRMNSNTPQYCPVCYTSIKTTRDHETGHHFRSAHAGCFFGSGRSDRAAAPRHVDPAVRRLTAPASPTRSAASSGCPGSWQFKPNDQVYRR